ncbi:small integral membrane protein 14 [Rhynchophorus ferrugineus]|uniref:Small integral membrane protein 14 n=1 Tax=Rhynchophorus ferrugineus TaxID=354439 RepID=A0A834IR85_RHYFE|nr:hypothetical protein GWI33_002329 [Rhynchophorus ferrugineus]
MSDESNSNDFNPCECFWNHELAMRRLLNILRNSQNHCTDNECFETDSTPTNNQNTPEHMYLITFLLMASILLYCFRPSRRSNETLNKPTSGHGSNDENPPSPTN